MSRWGSWFKGSTILHLKGGERPYLWDPHSQKNWYLDALPQCAPTDLPLAPWDVRIDLETHLVLCVSPLPGLHRDEYPAYWHNTVQKAFPEQSWAISQPEVSIDIATLLTAWPQSLADALKPFDAHIQWLRPCWSVAFAQNQQQLSFVQQTEVIAWIWEEDHHMLWLQRHGDPRLGWKKAVIRHVPDNKEARQEWFSTLLAREIPEYADAQEKTVPRFIHLDAATCLHTVKPILHTRSLHEWRMHTSTPTLWMPEGGL